MVRIAYFGKFTKNHYYKIKWMNSWCVNYPSINLFFKKKRNLTEIKIP